MAWQVGCFIYDTLLLIKRDGWGWESRDIIGIWGVGEYDLEIALHRCGIWKQGYCRWSKAMPSVWFHVCCMNDISHAKMLHVSEISGVCSSAWV